MGNAILNVLSFSRVNCVCVCARLFVVLRVHVGRPDGSLRSR